MSVFLTLGAHAQRGLRYLVVCLSVCLSVVPFCVSVLSVCLSIRPSVKSHLTSGASVRPENTVVYSVGNGDQKIYGVSGFNLDMSP